MKWLGWGVLAFMCLMASFALPASAQIDTEPSSNSPTKVSGPLLITGYSFSGHLVNYVQIYNSSSNVMPLDGWSAGYEYDSVYYTLRELQGYLAPKQFAAIANSAVLPSATFTFNESAAAMDPMLTSVQLVPPSGLYFNEETASPTVTPSTVRVAGAPATFYFARAVSASTGNFNSTFSAFVPNDDFVLLSDELYQAPSSPSVSIVEIYPDAPSCAPTGAAICSDYVKVFNGTPNTIDLSKLRLRTGAYGQAPTSSNTAQLTGSLASGSYASFPLSLSSSGSWVWLEDAYGVVRYDSSIIGYPSSSGHDGQAWSYHPAKLSWQWAAKPQPGNIENQFPAASINNACTGLKINEIAANVASEDQFIELINGSGSTLAIDGCLLQTNRSLTKSYELTGNLAAGETRVIYIKDTGLTLTKTTSGTVYVLSSDALTESDAVEYADLAENTSLALMGNEWVETYAPTPSAANVWQEYPACDEGYVRNTETGYCNKIQVATTAAGCGEGKYRSPETNRCRNLAAAGSMLMPCAVNQVRNPVTNRCRVATTAGSLKPCTANQERNPATSRCRNKGAAVVADFPVEAVADSAEATLGWWAFGGVGLLALGYAGWEWRSELMNAIKKVMTFIPGRA